MTNGNESEAETALVPKENPPSSMIEARGLTEQDILQAEKQAGLVKKMVLVSLKRTDKSDWYNYDDKPYLSAPGAEKLAMLWGISLGEVTFDVTHQRDEKGAFIEYVCTGPVFWKGRTFTAVGTSWTRNNFLGKKSGEFKLLEDIDLPSVRKMAYTNWLQNGVKRVLGLRNFSWDDLAEVFGADGVRWIQEKQDIKHKGKDVDKSKSDSADTAKLRVDILASVLILADGDPDKSCSILEQYTTWTDKEGKQVKGKRKVSELSEKQIEMNHGKICKLADAKMKDMSPDLQATLAKKVDEFISLNYKVGK